jgi:hypothetical protein
LKKDGKVKEGSPEWIHVLRQCQSKTGMLDAGHVCCPNCNEIVRPRLTTKKKKRKKVPLTVLLCPQTEDVFQWRGDLAPEAMVTSPAGFTFDPHKGHVTEKGRFVCPYCGNNDAVIESIRSLPPDQILPMHAYGLQAFAPGCAPANDPTKRDGEHDDLFGGNGQTEETEDEEETGQEAAAYSGPFVPPTHNLIWKQSGKFYARHAPADQALFSSAEKLWQKNRDALQHPKSEVPYGEKTKTHLLGHHFSFWHQLFNHRQLLALSSLLAGISAESATKLRNLLLCAFSNTLEANNMFTRNRASRNSPGGTAPGGIFSRHDFHPMATFCEQNVWGTVSGNNTFISRMRALRQGIAYAQHPYDGEFAGDGKHRKHEGLDPVPFDGHALLLSGDSRTEIDKAAAADLVITDPPYADNVNYSELTDFFYVWLRLVLKAEDAQFAPEYCPKTAEIVENKSRGLSIQNFEDGLTAVLKKSGEKITDDGLVIFTFHHAEGSSWESVLNSICNANLVIEAIYPVHAESEVSLHLMDKDAISYDLIHVCRKRRAEDTRAKRSWAGLRQPVRQRAKEEIARIEGGCYGGQPLLPPDVRMVLIGKCLEVYSRHYGAVMDWNGEPYPLKSALQDIRMMVEQIVSKDTPLPSELESVDAITQVWLVTLCDKREVSVDSISKSTRGVFEVSDLTGHKPPLLRKGRIKGGRTYEVLTPSERLDGLRQALRGVESNAQQLSLLAADDNTPIAFGPKIVDVIHLLAGNAEQGERLDHLVERFRGQREQIRAALQYLKHRDPDRWSKSADKLLPFYDDLFAQAAAQKGAH